VKLKFLLENPNHMSANNGGCLPSFHELKNLSSFIAFLGMRKAKHRAPFPPNWRRGVKKLFNHFIDKQKSYFKNSSLCCVIFITFIL
jgi:hypothetical protein